MAKAAKFDLTDDSVVVVVGTGAGGGVLANELAQKGVKVVALEAGGRYLPEDYVNDEWESFGQLAWADPRTTSGDWRVAKDFRWDGCRPPLTASQCAKVVVFNATQRRGRQDEGYDDRG